MRRRVFIAALGGAAAASLAWSPRVPAQPADRPKRIGYLAVGIVGDAESQARLAAFRQRLRELGWVEERDIRIDVRIIGARFEGLRERARELLDLAPAAIVVSGIRPTAALRTETRTVPIVFVFVADPIGQGFVDSRARPAGNVTGFTHYDPAMGGKWLQTLREVAPSIARVGLLAHPQGSALTYRTAVEEAARALAIDVVDIALDHAEEIEPALVPLAEPRDAGPIAVADGFNIGQRDRIVALAARYRLPAIYPYAFFATAGGLISYGVDRSDHVRQAAGYVDRILHGAQPADLPVQTPTKFELVVNLKTAKALGLTVPTAVLLRADEVIE